MQEQIELVSRPVPVVVAAEVVTAGADAAGAPVATEHSHSGGEMDHSEW